MFRSTLALACAVALAGPAAAGTKYVFTDLGRMFPDSINSYGQVSGTLVPTSGTTRQPLLWTPVSANQPSGSTVVLPGTSAGGINDYGQVALVDNYGLGYHVLLWTPSAAHATAGSSVVLDGGDNLWVMKADVNSMGQVTYSEQGLVIGSESIGAFVWTPTSPLGSVGSSSLIGTFQVNAINDYGQVAGYILGNGRNDAVLWTPAASNGSTGSLTMLGDLGQSSSQAYGLNNNGQVVGTVLSNSNNWLPFRWDPTAPNATSGSMTELDTVEHPSGNVYAVQEDGTAMGGFYVAPNSPHAALYHPNGQIQDLQAELNLSGVTLYTAYGSNSAGQLIGIAMVGTEEHGYLLTPKSVEGDITNTRSLVSQLVSMGALLPANGQSLYSKLDSAMAKASSGDKAGAITEMKAFINQVTTFVKKGRLTQAQAQPLIDAANAIIAQLSA